MTLALEIGWVVASPLLLWAAFVDPQGWLAPAKFGEVFAALGVPVPPVTRFFLDIGGAGVAALYGGLGVLPVAARVLARRTWLETAALVGSGVGTWILTDLFTSAMVAPVKSWFEGLR